MATWNEFEIQTPEIAAAAHRLFGLDGTALGYIATVSEEGSPRIAPASPILSADNLYLILGGETPTAADLMRGSAFAFHAPLGAGNEELVLAGTANLIVYGYEREAAQRATRVPFDPDDLVFRLTLGSAVRSIRESGSLSWEG